MKNKIIEDIKNAMRSQNKLILNVLRAVKGSIQLEEIKKKEELTDDEIITIIRKQIKMRKESITEFVKGNRDDLITIANDEIDILKKYMPIELTMDEINNIIDNAFKEINPTGINDLGQVMKVISPIVKGKCDLSLVNNLIKEKLDK